MGGGDWFRAFQVPVLPVSAGAALVGSALGSGVTGALLVPMLALVLASLVLIQAAANLQKGIVEAADLPQRPARPASPFAFDAGALGRTGISPGAARRLAAALFAAGAGVGLLVVVLARDPVLLALGALGAFLAYSYSGPPFKLSYRGIGEVSTFLAFGPLMVWGAYRAQVAPALNITLPHASVGFLSWEALWVGLAFGALAAMVSFARYFPAADEDRAKGKRTPVVALGQPKASAIFLGLVATACACLALASLVPSYDWCTSLLVYPPPLRLGTQLPVAATVAGCVGAGAFAALRSRGPRRVEAGVAATVVLHLIVTAVVASAFAPALFGC